MHATICAVTACPFEGERLESPYQLLTYDRCYVCARVAGRGGRTMRLFAEKPLVVLQALGRAKRIDESDPEYHIQLTKFSSEGEAMIQTDQFCVLAADCIVRCAWQF